MKKNILNNFNIKKIILYGINDNMKFVIPSVYSFPSIKKLISKTKKSLDNLIQSSMYFLYTFSFIYNQCL